MMIDCRNSASFPIHNECVHNWVNVGLIYATATLINVNLITLIRFQHRDAASIYNSMMTCKKVLCSHFSSFALAWTSAHPQYQKTCFNKMCNESGNWVEIKFDFFELLLSKQPDNDDEVVNNHRISVIHLNIHRVLYWWCNIWRFYDINELKLSP